MKYVGLIALAAIALGVSGCSGPDTRGSSAPDEPGLFTITARGLKLEGADTIPSGWTTVRFDNQSGMVHFVLIERMPEGYGIKDQQKDVAPIFQQGMDLLNAGKPEEAGKKFAELPKWFGEIVFMGGPGLTAPGRTSQATVFLEPGNYLAECYVKTNGVFHSYNPDPAQYGMVHAFTVSPQASGAPEPNATVRITISSSKGMEVQGTPAAGKNTVAVYFADQTIYKNFLGHDVHVARLTESTDMQALATWMDWRQPTGLETPAPAKFFGGTHDMPAGSTAYFTVQLDPGSYAWIAEVDDPAGKGMLKTFSVP